MLGKISLIRVFGGFDCLKKNFERGQGGGDFLRFEKMCRGMFTVS